MPAYSFFTIGRRTHLPKLYWCPTRTPTSSKRTKDRLAVFFLKFFVKKLIGTLRKRKILFAVKYQNPHKENLSQVNEDIPAFSGFINQSEEETLRENIFRPPLEKLQLFTRMLRREALLKSAKIIRH